MADRASYALRTVADATGVDVTLYTSDGRLLHATGTAAPFRQFSAVELSALPLVDEAAGYTYFAVQSRPHKIGILSGAGEAFSGYARLAARLIENELGHTVDENERLRLVLSGEATEAQLLSARADFKTGTYSLFALMCPASKQRQLESFMRAFKDANDLLVAMNPETIAYVRRMSNDDEYQSASEFAGILHDNLSEELPFPIKICIGDGVSDFAALETSYAHAVFAYRYGTLIDPTSDVYNYKEYALIKMLSEVNADAFARYAASIVDDAFRAVLRDEELVTTAEMFIKNSLNISETSRNMFMHRNTLIYRLDKIEKATGLDIRRFSDAFTFRLIYLMYKLRDF